MIIQSLPPAIFAFLSEVENLGFSLCLVGGIPRDFFYFNTLGNDLDFEIRPREKLDDPIITWPTFYERLYQFLFEKKIPYTKLPYLITRVFFEGVHFEFSSPRTEKAIPDNYSHHHFEAVLDPHLNYNLSFKRRDFTINAIGVELNFKMQTEKIVDPFEGIKDLKNGILRNITDDFFFDSVRFLRLIRFKLKFERFVIDELLYASLKKFNLAELSVHHFKEELFKSRPGAFLNKFREIVLEKKLNIPNEFILWTKFKFPEKLSTKEELLAFVFLESSEDAHKVVQFFSMPEKKLKDVKSFYHSYENLKRLKRSDLMNILSLPFADALEHSIFKDLKNLEEKKEWRSVLLSGLGDKDLLINWDDWSAVCVNADEFEQINPAQRSYYQFYKTLKMKFSND